MKYYIVIIGKELPEFRKTVNHHINRGYELVGGISIAYENSELMYSQALLLDEDL